MSHHPKITFITGATSDFGAAFARRFAGIGSALILHGRNAEKLETLAKSLPDVPKYLLVADLGKPGEIEAAIAAIPPAFQDIDLLINNAGGALGLDRFYEISLADADAMIDANCRSLVHVSRLVMPRMAMRKTGHVINISSVAANWPYPGGNVYGACKAFAKQLTLAMRCDLQGTNIRVTSIEPGLCETSFSLKRFKGDAGKAGKVYADTEPLTAEDIAESVFWVATLPPHMNVNSLEVMPTRQSWSAFAIERN
ncbi:MAG: SDR family NAD(P)-dependent oxidoreductase [Alphaproteobacteria bacterium]